jgi:hypothetical protein
MQEKMSMNANDRTDVIMKRMGFEPSDEGRMVSRLRGEIARQVHEHGLVNRSAGTWAPEYGPAGMFLGSEERARAFLEMEWSLARGYSSEVKCLDRPWGRKRDLKKGRTYYFVDWKDIPVWFGDRWRSFKMDLRIAFDRLRGIRNPYSR